ncbi:MAG: PD-(D/E)XK nuclease family protein [Verrucomicrobiales bacterium]|jgi:hypothetical protein|nr:PD-(D/E)XK nuclease family protein [Verrucomicrobiales bacterium]
MSQLINTEKASHWYYPDGRACHTVPRADGAGERATTLRDARKLGLLPSVTQILKVKAKPGLENWKLEQAILSALTLPRGTEESDTAFAQRVVKDMDEEAARAAAWGTKIHACCEGLHAGGVLVADEQTRPFVADYERWVKAELSNTAQAEVTLVNQKLGYAGRVDLVAVHREHGPVVVDLKTQKVRDGQAVFYPEWALQLAAYAAALPGQYRLASVVINSLEPSAVAVKFWAEADYLALFECCLKLWKFEKGL